MTASHGKLSEENLAAYHRDGYYIYRKLFDDEEIGLLGRAAREDKIMDEKSFSKDDGTGADVRLSLWNHPGDGIYGMFARCRKLVDSVEQILEGGHEIAGYCDSQLFSWKRSGSEREKHNKRQVQVKTGTQNVNSCKRGEV